MISRLTRAGATGLFCFGLVFAGALDHAPTPDEKAALKRLRGALTGRIVWESNRTGQWELYAMNADGTDARQLTHLAKPGDSRAYPDYLRPRLSPDGGTILFAYGKARAPCEVWTMPATGGTPRKLTVGNPLNWASDSRRIYFVRDSLVRAIEVQTGRESVVHKTRVPTDGRSGGMVGTLAPDMKSAVFRTPKRNEYFVLSSAKTIKTMGGCEPSISADGRYLYWVLGPKDFQVWEIGTKREHQLLGTPPVKPFNYTYFPTVSADGGWLMYGASPGEHSHSTSDYEVYLQRLESWRPAGKPVRLTFNKRTDRWPFLWLGPSQAPPATAPRVADARRELPIFMFQSKDAPPEFGGDWGLWPQTEGCRGDTTFLPNADADGGPGGAMRIDYVIRRPPRSFSLWITSGDNPVDLSELDRFTLWAKGSVPSFTLVVKDRHATDADAPDGIADCLVTGLTDEWQRLELPFAEFRPREAGTRVDWGSVHHAGIAMVAPGNDPAGRLFVDNLRAERKRKKRQPPPPADDTTGRVTAGLVALLPFTEGGGSRITSAAAGGRPELKLMIAQPDAVRWLDRGVAITAPTLIAAAKPTAAITDACRRSGEITIEAWITPTGLRQSGPARIFTLSADTGQRNFTVGQEEDRYIVRLRTTRTSANGTPRLETPQGSLKQRLTHVVYTRAGDGAACIYIDGDVSARGTIAGDLSNWDPGYRLALANELTGDRPWLGEFHLAAIYSRVLTPAEVRHNWQARPGTAATESPPTGERERGPGGWIVWESNRNGSWQLYSMDIDGKGVQQLTSAPGDHTQAGISRDGKRVLYTQQLPGESPSVWVMNNDGTSPAKLIENAASPSWRQRDRLIQFTRQPDRRKKNWQTWEYNVETRAERLLFPKQGVKLDPDLWAATGNDDGTRFVAWSPKPRGTWILSEDGRIQAHVHGGCEGRVGPNQRYAYGVHESGDFVRFDLTDGGNMVRILRRDKGPWNHTYFPCVSSDKRWLVYGACPPDQHDHDTSDYEIFLVGLEDWKAVGEPLRLTHDKRTDRWPAVYVPTSVRTARESQGEAGERTAGDSQAWRGGFDDGDLEARWQWRTPVSGPTLSLTDRPGCLRVRLPERASGFNHWNEPKPVDEAPQLRAPPPEGDWVLEARVRLQQVAVANAFHVGLVAGLGDDFLLSFGPFQAPALTGGPKTPEVWFEPTGSSGFRRVSGDARDVRLRLVLKGTVLRARLSRDGKDWVEAGAYLLPAAPRFVGLIGKTFSAGPPVVFDVDYVRLTPRPVPGPVAPRAVVGIGGNYPTGYRGLLARNGLPYEVLLDYQLADAGVLRRFDLLLIGSLSSGIASRAREVLMQVVREGGTALLDGSACPPASVRAGGGRRVNVKGVPDIVVGGTHNPLAPLLGKTTRFAAGESRYHYEPNSFAGLQILARYDGQPGGETKPAPAAGYTGTPAIWAMSLGRGLLVYSAPSLGATLSWGPTHDQLAAALIQRLAWGRAAPQLVPEGARLGRKQSAPQQAEKPDDTDGPQPPAFERVKLSSPAEELPRGASVIRTRTAPEFNLSGTYHREQGSARLLLNHWSRRFRVEICFKGTGVRLTRTEDGKVTDSAETALDKRAEVPFVIKERRDRIVFLAGARRAVLRGDGLWEGGLASSGKAVSGLRYQPVGTAFLSDDFMRGKDEQGAWKVVAGAWSVRATGDPKMGANPFTYRGAQPKGVGLSVTGFPFWDDYVFEVSAKPTSGSGAVGLAFHCRDGENHLLLRLRVVDSPGQGKDGAEIVRVDAGKEAVLTHADGCLVSGQWYRLAVQVRDGLVTAYVDGRQVAEAEDALFHAGRIALYVRDAEAEFDDVAVRPDAGAEAPVSAELDGPVPRFAGTLDRDTWAGTALQWRADPLVPGLFRRRGRFYGDFDLSFRCVFGGGTGAAADLALLLTPESGGAKSGYALVLRPAAPGRPTADASARRGYEAELTARGVSLGRCTVSSTAEPVLGLRRSGSRLLALVDGRDVLTGLMTSPPDQLSQLAFRATGFRPRISGLRLRAGKVLDTCFDHAPTDWWIGSGTWELAIRWPCTPEWSWLAGEGKNRGVAALWHKHRFAGDVTLDLHVGPRTVDHGDGRPREICRAFNVVLCGDGRDAKSGYSFVVGAGKNGIGATLTRNGKTVAHEPAYRIFSDAHNQWINVRAERQGGAIRLWVGDQGILSWEDPEPLPGGRLGIWTEDNSIMVPRVTVYHRQASTGATVGPG